MKSIIVYSIAIISSAFLFGACRNNTGTTKTDEMLHESIPVKIAAIQQAPSLSAINATGLITTENEARYSFKIAGIIEQIPVSEGQFFKKGQVLASLKITEIDAQLTQADINYEKAKRDYTRASNLFNDSVATLEQLQNAKTGLDVAQQVVDLVAFNKKYSRIYATSDGFITKKLANEGEVVAAGAPVLAINETGKSGGWILKPGLNDKDWSAIAIGDKATVTIDAFPGQIFQGEVIKKSQAADQSSGSFQAEIKLALNNYKPAIGMFAKATIVAAHESSLPVIPYDAVIEASGNNAFVFVPGINNSVRRIPVIIESFNNTQVVVKSGLENIPAVIVSNSAFLNERSIITIIK